MEMVLNGLEDTVLEEMFNLFSPEFIQEQSDLHLDLSFEKETKDVVFDYDFYISDLKLGYLSVIVNGDIKMQTFQPLKEKPFLRRNGSNIFSLRKKHSYNLGLLSQAKMCSLLVDTYGSKFVAYSEPISDLAKKFYKGIGIDPYVKPKMRFKDYSNKIFQAANKKGFKFDIR